MLYKIKYIIISSSRLCVIHQVSLFQNAPSHSPGVTVFQSDSSGRTSSSHRRTSRTRCLRQSCTSSWTLSKTTCRASWLAASIRLMASTTSSRSLNTSQRAAERLPRCFRSVDALLVISRFWLDAQHLKILSWPYAIECWSRLFYINIRNLDRPIRQKRGDAKSSFLNKFTILLASCFRSSAMLPRY